MLATPWISALGALFLWWFSTGAILVIVRRADRAEGTAGLCAVLWGLPFLLTGAAAFYVSLSQTGVAGTLYRVFGRFGRLGMD
jgi:hypothetical protein